MYHFLRFNRILKTQIFNFQIVILSTHKKIGLYANNRRQELQLSCTTVLRTCSNAELYLLKSLSLLFESSMMILNEFVDAKFHGWSCRTERINRATKFS